MRQLMIMAMVMWWGLAAGQRLPHDGACMTVYGIEAEIGEVTDGVCDLSGATVTKETELRFEYYGDTLVRRVAGPRADWLRTAGDTIWSVGADTRRDNIRHTCGLPYLLPCGSADAIDSLRHSVFLSFDRENAVGCRYSSHRGCGYILPGGDTIASTYCVETLTADSCATVRHRRWYAQEAVWPVVEEFAVRTGEEELTEVNVCPPGSQPAPRAAAKGTKDTTRGAGNIYDMLARIQGGDTPPSQPGMSPDIPAYVVTVDREGIHVTVGDGGEATARLFDSAGRQWHEGSAPATIDTSRLPAGVYLLNISTGTSSSTTEILITGQ